MTSSPESSFKDSFNDPNYAWELLQWQIAIEMNDSLSGQAIAKLLQLYMKGVEKMNSIMDVRQSYFKNKVTSLMTKNAVVKTLSKPPMAKKEKPLEMMANKDGKKEIKIIEKTKIKESQEIKPVQAKIEVKLVNTFALQEKKKEIEMRLAYEAQESTRENLNKLVNLHQKKQEIFQDKIKGIINDHEQRLKQRIHRRKLKTATYRSRPEDTNDTASKQLDVEIMQQKKQIQQNFIQSKSKIQQKFQQKRFKSLQSRVMHDLSLQDSPRRARKSTFDMIGENLSPVLEINRIKSEQLKILSKQ